MIITKRYSYHCVILFSKQFIKYIKNISIFIVLSSSSFLSSYSLQNHHHHHHHDHDKSSKSIVNISIVDENIHPFNAGHDIDGQNLFICRTHKFGQIIPGKYSHNIGKCSIGRNQKEWQFNQFELLIEDDDTKYEWIRLKKPVIDLPDNVLYAGRQIEPYISNNRQLKHHQNYEFLNILSSNKSNYKSIQKRRRYRRDIFDNHQNWSRNWRGFITNITDHHHLRRFHHNRQDNFIEIPIGNCSQNEHHHDRMKMKQKLCLKNEKRKLNYFIAKCSLRTGDKISEQIGKIWWKNSNQEWIASFPFGGHEIYCLDYSVLTLKN